MSNCNNCNNNLDIFKSKKISKKIIEQTNTHPCFSAKAHDYAIIHLPIAPKCNISCNYCNRKYDCQNESRPGVTSEVLSPEKALKTYEFYKERVNKLSVVGIAGPGDALANFNEFSKTIELIKTYDKKVTFCLSTNGLALPDYAEQIIDLGIHHVTITINSIDPLISSEIYKFIHYRGSRYTGKEAGSILLENQLKGLETLSSHGVLSKINIVCIEGINDYHIEKVVKTVTDYGAFMTNIIPMIPVEDTPFENLKKVSQNDLMKLRKTCEKYITQMYHCKQCRADAVGKLGKDCRVAISC